MNLIFTLITFLSNLVSQGQSSFNVTHYSQPVYGAGSQNWSMDADNRGFIYAGNNNGLLQFDGAHWKLYPIPDQTIVRSVLVSDDQKVYTGSYEDFGFWEEDLFKELRYHSLKPLLNNFLLHNDEIWKIVQCNNKVYFQSFSALFVYDHHSVKPIPLPSSVIFLLKANNRMFVHAVDGRFFELVNDSLILLTTREILTGTEVKTVLPYKNGSILIGTSSKGVFLYDGKTMVPWNVPANEALKKFQINNGIVVGDKIIFGTIVEGIFILDYQGRVLFHLHNKNALQNNTVLSLCTDNRGGIWAGLDRGIDNISFNNPLDVYKEPGEHLGAVYTAALVGNTLYIGTNRGIYTYLNEKEEGRFRYKGFLDQWQGQVWELKEIDGYLFCGHNDGTYIVEGDQLKMISTENGGFALEKYINNGQEYLVQSTYSSLVIYKKSENHWRFYLQVKGFIEPSRYMEIDHLNNIWIGHAVKGLYRLRLSDDLDTISSMTGYGKKDGFPSDFNIRVFKIEERIIFATGKSLYTYDDLMHKIIPYTELNKQLEGFENATNIVKIAENRYCLIRNNDIGVFEIKENKANLMFRFFLPLFGLNMVQGYENVVNLNKKLNLLCLDDGFAVLPEPSFKFSGNDNAKLMFREVKCMNSAGDQINIETGDRKFTLDHSRNSLFVSFTYTDHRISEKMFQYQLEPFDPDWSQWSAKSDVSYMRLPRGEYTLKVRTISPTGVITAPIKLHFRVKPVFFASPLAYVFYGIIFLIAIFIIHAVFRRRLLRQQLKIRKEAESKLFIEKQQAEQEIVKLQNEKLQSEISHKNIQLADSTMAIIKKNELLIEIKKEFENQKKQIGNQYPANFNSKILSLINKNITDDNDWKVFEELFDQAHADFFKRLKSNYPELTQSDLKLCAYLRLNLTSKEIAPLLNISYRGVETRRYRIRKRLLLDSDENLVEFILQF